jgi:4-carboxymuconolactone decarboxylase
LSRTEPSDLGNDEVIAALTHLAFYAGWRPAMTGLRIARTVFDEING